jgi:hypothetical protein
VPQRPSRTLSCDFTTPSYDVRQDVREEVRQGFLWRFVRRCARGSPGVSQGFLWLDRLARLRQAQRRPVWPTCSPLVTDGRIGAAACSVTADWFVQEFAQGSLRASFRVRSGFAQGSLSLDRLARSRQAQREQAWPTSSPLVTDGRIGRLPVQSPLTGSVISAPCRPAPITVSAEVSAGFVRSFCGGFSGVRAEFLRGSCRWTGWRDPARPSVGKRGRHLLPS